MSYSIDKTAHLEDAVRKGYKARAVQLRAEGVPTKQHNVGVKKTAANKASTTKKTAAKKTTTKKS
jgi:hypothetical protein